MQKGQKLKQSLIFGGSALAVAAGVTLGSAYLLNFSEQWPDLRLALPSNVQNQPETSSEVFALAQQPASQRAERLKAIAQDSRHPEHYRARYLLASDLINQQQGAAAIPHLEKLETNYPVLAPYVVYKRAQAYALNGQSEKAQQAWKELLEGYPQHPVSVEAMYVLGQENPELWQQAIAQFPSHPRSVEIIRNELAKNPNQPQLKLALVRAIPDSPSVVPVLDQLVNQSGQTGNSQTSGIRIQPQDWDAIAWSYWHHQEYGKAGEAYAKATPSPLHAYRHARGLQLVDQTEAAKIAYQKLIATFPTAKETGLGLRRLAGLSQPPEALAYLDRVIKNFPDEAPAALLSKSELLQRQNSSQSAAQALQILLSQYGDSDTAAEYRWKVAQQKAAAGDILAAWQWAQPITQQHPESILAPRAAFWVGKWAQQLGRSEDAKASFSHVLSKYPQSYYAWRSAVLLGLQVGDFKTVRPLLPTVVRPQERPLLPAGSDTFKELYRLSQDRDAIYQWQAEFSNRRNPSVGEEFTDGILQLKVKNYIQGIGKISSLEDRETPAEQAEYRELRQQPFYWHALYPFPYLETIENWSQQRQLNPLLVISLIRQESRFMPQIKSVAGAVGLMQVMPGTGKWIAEKTNTKDYNLEKPEDNIRMGTWFLNYTHSEYNDNSLLAVASYNAGPGNVSKWVRERGNIDPDLFVEQIPFDETKGYVRSVFGNYWNYLRLYNPEIAQVVSQYTGQPPAVTAK